MNEKLSPAEIARSAPLPPPSAGDSPLAAARARVTAAGHWGDWQALGRRFAVGCVALEITQRCNLDCEFCYLSESSEALHDIPLDEVKRRIALILTHYGPGTDVQITGGEPTLRRRDELCAIVRAVAEAGLRPTLLTNGIRASRSLLSELARAGLVDVAFHVDTTQGRKAYATEAALNEVRRTYIERARGLGLSVLFNTTVTAGNLHEIPGLVRFFMQEHEIVRLCSFQPGASTGRGIGVADSRVNAQAIIAAIREGTACQLNFDAVGTGPAACNRYAYAAIIGSRAFDVCEDAPLVRRLLDASAQVYFDRKHRRRAVQAMVGFLCRHPRLLGGVLRRLLALGWSARRELVSARGKVGKLSFFVHSFMDADALERSRLEACSFMVMTPEGPMSMCLHNARRDDYLLVPAKLGTVSGLRYFNPVTGRLEDRIPTRLDVELSRRNARGRARQRLTVADEPVTGAGAAAACEPMTVP